jgi:hypothetical protein
MLLPTGRGRRVHDSTVHGQLHVRHGLPDELAAVPGPLVQVESRHERRIR